MHQLYFILIEPSVPENVGAAARAMKTMGFEYMRLVNPCDYKNNKARALAHASNDILENAKVFRSFEEAIADIDFIIGTTAKERTVKYDYHDIQELPEIISAKGNTIKSTAIIFGCEEYGLKNEELKKCDILTTIPLKNLYPSLNLGQAIMLYSYVLSSLNIKHQGLIVKNQDIDELKALKYRITRILETLDMGPDTIIYGRFMERIMLLGEDDIHLLHSFCKGFEAKYQT